MTRYFIDDREITPPAGMASFDEIMKCAEECHLPSGSAIRQIWVDGSPMNLDTSESPGATFGRMQNLERIEIFTAPVLEVARDAALGAIDYLDRIETVIPSMAWSFRNYPEADSFRNLRQLLDGFYWLSLLLDKLAANFKIPLETCGIKGVSTREHLTKFAATLKRLVDSQETGNSARISNLIEHEVIPAVPVWKGMFRWFLAELDRAQWDERKPVK